MRAHKSESSSTSVLELWTESGQWAEQGTGRADESLASEMWSGNEFINSRHGYQVMRLGRFHPGAKRAERFGPARCIDWIES
jgi:hypothetical protein